MKQNNRKSNKNTCFCTQELKKQLIATAGCSDDLAAVSALPDNWVPRNSGPILINYLKEREKNHNDLLNSLAEDARIVNIDIDVKVRNISEMLLCYIRQNETDIETVLERTKSDTPLQVDERNNVLKQITKLTNQRTEYLMEFRQESLALEKLREDGLRNVLKRQFQHFITVGHKPPKVLLHDFDEQIYEVNHQLTSNSRAYIELEAQLRLQLEEKIVRVRSLVNEYCLSDVKAVSDSSTLPFVKHLNFSQKYIESNKNEISKDKSCSLEPDLKTMKNNISKILDAYDGICLKIFQKFSDQLDCLDNNRPNSSLNQGSSDEILKLDNFIDDATRFILKYNEVNPVQDNFAGEKFHNYIAELQNNLSSCIRRLYDAYSILSNLCRIWVDHVSRSSLLQKFIVLGLEDFQTIQDASELCNEVNFDIALEQMRCAPDLDKLQQQFDIITSYLNKKTETYRQQKDAEIAKIEDFMKYLLLMSNILQSEFYSLLDKHPKLTTQLPKFASTAENFQLFKEELLPLRVQLSQVIFQTQLQEQEMIDITNNYIECFENIFLTIPELINQYSKQFIDTKCSLVNMRYSLKLTSHSIREERVKTAHGARLSELRYHDMRLGSHLDALYNLIDRLPIEASDFLEIDSPILYPFSKWINDIKIAIETILAQESVDPEYKKLKMSSYALRLLKHRQLFEESLDSAINDFKYDIQRNIQNARISNVGFVSRLKLFFEGGRFAATEAIRSCNALVKAGDALESCVSRTMDALHQRRIQLLASADQQMLPLQRIVEDISKHGAKGALDKKKLPLNKSK